MKYFAFVFTIFMLSACGPAPEPTAEQQAKQLDKKTIAHCWSLQAKKSNNPESARFIAGACEKAEDDFRAKYKLNP